MYVYGIAIDDLSDPNQGLCSVEISFEHEFLGDLSISLESPDGQIIDLVGAPVFLAILTLALIV